MADPLLRTKLFIPAPRPSLVPRPRLIQQLQTGTQLNRKLSLISAPAGFGKTTLVSDWLTTVERPVAWLSLDEADGDLGRFLTYFVAAIQTVAADVGTLADSMLQAQPLPPVEALMTALVNDLAGLRQPMMLVLDDYHVLDSAEIDDTPTQEAEVVVETEETAVADSAEENAAESDHDHETIAYTNTGELNIDLFYDDALAEDATIVDCTLSDGTATSCYEITISGYPADSEVGPFCPPTIDSTAEEGGLWLDGEALYDIDGEFILNLAEIYNDDNWKLYDDEGNVNITDTAEEFELAARPDVDPSLENHCVEGRIEWLEDGEPVPTTVTIPITPVMSDASSSGGNWGVTLNGVIIAAQAPVDAILSAYTIAAFDDCGGHINPFDGYHLHGARGCSEVGEAAPGETPIFGYALDGYPIHSPLDTGAADLDQCNGHTTEAYGYHYHAAPAEDNAVLSCLRGLTAMVQGPPR